MYTINRYIYVDKHTRNKFEIFARNVDFADSLIKRINNLGVFSLRRARLHFYKVTNLDIPPYELEQEQDRTVSDWEKKKNDNEKE